MLWPAILPAQITVAILLGIILIWMTVAPRRHKQPGVRLIGVLGILLFIPSCAGVMLITDYCRFGVFHFPDMSTVYGAHLRSSLPSAATEITVEALPNGNHAKYVIADTDLKTWHEQFWNSHTSTVARNEIDSKPSVDSELFARRFGHLKWSLPADSEFYHGPVSTRGGSYSLWYSPAEQTAYQVTAYW